MNKAIKTEIRRAHSGDAARLTEIAFAAKRHWNYPERWIELWRETLTITPEFISANDVYVAEVEGQATGFYALMRRGRKATLEHMWVMPDAMGMGLGKRLFNHAVATAREVDAAIIEIESDPNAEGFYSRMGARRVGEVSSELEGRPRVLPLLVFDL
jgi:GNAT superfamily N-acetyltransferase